jgi:hypothetical protein
MFFGFYMDRIWFFRIGFGLVLRIGLLVFWILVLLDFLGLDSVFQDLVSFIRILAFDRDVKMVNYAAVAPSFSCLSFFLRRLVSFVGFSDFAPGAWLSVE